MLTLRARTFNSLGTYSCASLCKAVQIIKAGKRPRCTVRNVYIFFPKYIKVLGFTIAETFYNVQEHETNISLILNQVRRSDFSFHTLFRTSPIKALYLDAVFC